MSPSAAIQQNKKQQLTESDGPNKPPKQEDYRGHQVNYSFGQQPFKDANNPGNLTPRQKQPALNDYNYSGSSTIRKIGVTSGQGTTRVNNHMPHLSGQPQFTVMSSVPSEQNSQSNRDSSKVHKSAVSMTSVMGELHQPGSNQLNNIFAQSIQQSNSQVNSQVRNTAEMRPPATAVNDYQLQKTPATSQMTLSQQNFAQTADKVDSVERMCKDGLSNNVRRESVHRAEAESMGLRKSQEGSYEDIDAAQDKSMEKKIDLATKNAYNVVATAAQMVAKEGKVPDEIRNQMLQQGFRPSSKNEAQFEYDSDTVERYEMISNEFDYEELRRTQLFGIKQYKDCIYKGQLNPARQREGCGVLVYQNGRVYEGEWLRNKRHGRGYEVFSNGNSYHGAYEDGKANGKGVYQWKNGEVYDGEWLKGIKHGYGVWKGTNGESYIGQWVNSKAQGYGVHVFANGDKYEGEWLQCLREGNGSDFFANGDCYVGQYSNGKPEGFGQYKWKNGSSYTGQFTNGLKHGHGKWKKKQADEHGQTKCNSYEGMYENDKKHGYGVFDWESGNQYQGSYNNDERHGYGVMKWTDESMYMGIWDQGIQHGVGVMIFPDGVRRAGVFEDNIFKESLKRQEQIDPYRELLKDDCLQILEELVAQRQQSKANLFGPLNKSKAELAQKEFTNADLNVNSSQILGRGGSTEKTSSVKEGSKDLLNVVNDVISDNASVINKPMREVENEDLMQTMQKGNPMRNSINSLARSPNNASQSLPPMPATANPTQVTEANQNRSNNDVNRSTIEVQTDLSMVTMEQYSQGYNSKAFMNKTQDFNKAPPGSNTDVTSQHSPIKFQNDLNPTGQFQSSLNQSRKDFQNVLSNPQFQDTKHQQEILGGDNPNEDTESEWNRNNSSMMVVQKNNPLNGSVNSFAQKKNEQFQFVPPTKIVSNHQQIRSKGLNSRVSRKKSQESSLKVSRTQNNSIVSPYVSNQRLGERPVAHSIPRDNKFNDRNLMANRQMQRNDRSLPVQHASGFGGGVGNFIVPGPQQEPKPRQNAFNLGGSESRKPPQKMFQSQYGGTRFGGVIHPSLRQNNQLPNPQNMFQQNQPYNVIDTPQQNRTQYIPNSEQQNPYMRNASNDPAGLPNIFSGGSIHDTPVMHHGVARRSLMGAAAQPTNGAMNQFVHGFNPQQQQREDILTPSPKRLSNASHIQNTQGYDSSFHQNNDAMNRSQNNQSIADHSGINVEPMFGNDYGQKDRREYGKRINSMEVESNTDNFRGMTSKSSQRTLRYNDFELVQKEAKDDPAFEVHLDEIDNKDSSRESRERQDSIKQENLQMQKLYESTNHGLQSHKSTPFGTNVRNSGSFLPKMAQIGVNRSIEQQKKDERQRRHLNSNDTQLASHTINLNASQNESPLNHNHVIVQHNKRVQRSLPPTNTHNSKISVKPGISLMNAGYGGSLNRANAQGHNKTTISPRIASQQKGKFLRKQRNDDSQGSRGRFGFVGPYAQNLKKPKLYEARGTQKIALKNHIASMNRQHAIAGRQQQPEPFNSEVFANRKKSSLNGGPLHDSNQLYQLSHDAQVEDRGDKHSDRFNSNLANGEEFQGNYIIQHQSLANKGGYNALPQMSSLPQMSHEHNTQKHKRVWVPYNKKMKLKGIQQVMVNGPGQIRSNGSGNPLLNSN